LRVNSLGLSRWTDEGLPENIAMRRMRFVVCACESEAPARRNVLVSARATRRYVACGVYVVPKKVGLTRAELYRFGYITLGLDSIGFILNYQVQTRGVDIQPLHIHSEAPGVHIVRKQRLAHSARRRLLSLSPAALSGPRSWRPTDVC
jgi:hypothetical protein